MSINLVPELAIAGVRALVLGLTTFTGLLLFRVRTPAVRHAAWTMMLAGMLLQIPLGLFVPTVPLRVLPASPARDQLLVPQTVTGSTSVPTTVAASLGWASEKRIHQKSVTQRWDGTLATGVYLLISILFFMRIAVGSWGLHRIHSHARAVSGLGSKVYESAFFVAPASVGCFWPKIILPDTWRNWDTAKLRAVLAHERAHIRRRDGLIRFTSHVNVCVFWFHPLAWWIHRELANLAEEACDDAAVSEVKDREEYAAALLDVARVSAASRKALNWRIVCMARDSRVVKRVDRILDHSGRVPNPFGRLACTTLFACGAPLVYLSAAVILTPANRDATAVTNASPPLRAAQSRGEPPVSKSEPSVKRIAQAATSQPARPTPLVSAPRSAEPALTMCIVMDNSGSIFDKREAVKAAALAVVKIAKPGDEVCMVNFNDEVSSDLPGGDDFTSDTEVMEKALTSIESRGGKAMRDAVLVAIDRLQHTGRNGKKLLVLITEGNDTASNVTQEALVKEVIGSGVQVYAIGLVGEDDSRHADAARNALGQLAQTSGGVDYYPMNLAEVKAISSEVANELRTR